MQIFINKILYVNIICIFTHKWMIFLTKKSPLKNGEFKQQVQIYSILFKKHSLGVENSSFFLGLLLISCIYRVIC